MFRVPRRTSAPPVVAPPDRPTWHGTLTEPSPPPPHAGRPRASRADRLRVAPWESIPAPWGEPEQRVPYVVITTPQRLRRRNGGGPTRGVCHAKATRPPICPSCAPRRRTPTATAPDQRIETSAACTRRVISAPEEPVTHRRDPGPWWRPRLDYPRRPHRTRRSSARIVPGVARSASRRSVTFAPSAGRAPTEG